MKKISVITPAFNEALSIESCVFALRKLMQESLPQYEYEHIVSDNASTDETIAILKLLAKEDKNLKVLSNSRNIGPFRNMWSGMKFSTGDAVIPLLPADLQDPVSVIADFIKAWESGYLLVYGKRINREESLIMRSVRNAYYRTIRKFSQVDMPSNVVEFLLADRKVVDTVLQTDDEYPYIRGSFAQTGVKSMTVDYNWVTRKHGKSKNNYLDLIDQGVNGFVSTNRTASRLALLSGFFFAFVGLATALFNALILLVGRSGVQAGIPTLLVGVFFLGGIQLIFLGLIGEYVLSIHNQVKRAPSFFLLDKINFDSETKY
jgi:glycosyltransferase involved in cell wall biosynthesis